MRLGVKKNFREGGCLSVPVLRYSVDRMDDVAIKKPAENDLPAFFVMTFDQCLSF
jgi:hypothetical protein